MEDEGLDAKSKSRLNPSQKRPSAVNFPANISSRSNGSRQRTHANARRRRYEHNCGRKGMPIELTITTPLEITDFPLIITIGGSEERILQPSTTLHEREKRKLQPRGIDGNGPSINRPPRRYGNNNNAERTITIIIIIITTRLQKRGFFFTPTASREKKFLRQRR